MDIHSPFETLAEAWVAASTPTAVNPEPKLLKGSSIDDQPSMLPKDKQQEEKISEDSCDDNENDDRSHNDDECDQVTHRPAHPILYSSPSPGPVRESPQTSGSTMPSISSVTSNRNLSVMKTPSPRKGAETSQSGLASMPIRCIVEQVNGAVSFDTATSVTCDVSAVEEDTFAILPVTTPLRDLVRTALAKLGYSASETVSAKGAIQLKNWKPLTFDVITDDRSATIDDILRELKEYTLRIRLSSHLRQSSVEEMKKKLLQLLLTTSQSMLIDTGCPVEKSLLMSISKGDNFASVPEDMVAKFDTWYCNQISKDPKSLVTSTSCPASDSSKHSFKLEKVLPIKTEPVAHIQAASSTAASDSKLTHSSPSSTSSSHSSLSSPSSSHQPQFLNSGTGSYSQNHNLQSSTFLPPCKTRIRTSFDPEHEIPRLQKWFQENQHPSREHMVLYMSELNNLDSRKGRRPLDLTNIIYWFKNARAAQRRASKALDDSFENEENVDVSNGHSSLMSSSLSDPPAIPPYLPNKNAVYIVPYPYHTSHPSHQSSSSSLLSTPEPMADSNDEPCDLSIKKLKDTTSNLQDLTKAGQVHSIKSESFTDAGALGSCSRSNGSHNRKNSPIRNGYTIKTCGREEGNGYKSPFVFNGTSDSGLARKSAMSGGKDRQPSGGRASAEDRKLLEKHYQHFKEQKDREQCLVMNLKTDGDISSDESIHSNDSEDGRLRIQEEEEVDYASVRARAEIGLGMSQLAATTDSSAASMAALSLAQMSQPPLQIPMNHLNPLAMYYNLPRYYHPPSSHHPQSSAAATAAMVAAFSSSAHMNGHATNHNSSPSSNTSNPQSPASGRPVPIQPAPHPPLSNSHSHSRSSEPRKRRTRVFIDPLTEIPKLEKWFLEDTHPSAYMIDKYTETLNSAEYRQKFPKLEPKNIQLWFKNHRAKVKRQRVGLDETLCESPPPHCSRSATPLTSTTGREEGGSGSGGCSSPDLVVSSKHGDDVANSGHNEEQHVEEGEQ